LVNSSTVAVFDYACADSECTDCLVHEKDMEYGVSKCRTLSANGTSSFYVMPDGGTCLGPAKKAETTPTNGLTVLSYSGCGSPGALSEMFSVDEVTVGAEPLCKVIEGLPKSSPARYYKFYLDSGGTVTGGWMYEDEYCTTGGTEVNKALVGSSAHPATCSDYVQIWFSHSVGVCTKECACAGPPPSPPGPAPPVSKGYIYLNQYLLEDSPVVDCDLGDVWEEAIISRVTEGCHRFQHIPSAQDMYRLLELDDYGRIQKLGLYCGPDCDKCEDDYTRLKFGTCIPSQDDTSAALYPPEFFCMGSANTRLSSNGIVTFAFTDSGCDVVDQPNNIATIRGYPQATGVCQRDGKTKDPATYYKLEQTEGTGGLVFTGVMNCTSDDCTNCAVKVDAWEEGACQAVGDAGFLQIYSNENLKRCEAPPEPTGPTKPSTARPTPSPQTEKDQVVIIASVGAVILAAGLAGVVYYTKVARPKRRYAEIGGGARRERRRGRGAPNHSARGGYGAYDGM